MDAPEQIYQRNVPGTTEILGKRCVGVAGCGGLGSNAAVSLVRAGVGSLILVDDDVVEPSNLNRQHFFLGDLGRHKVDALADHLMNICPDVRLETHRKRIEPGDVATVFARADLLVEAFDRAQSKRWLLESWTRAFPERPMVCGNGISGCGNTEKLVVQRVGRVYFCGDQETEMTMGLCAPRVAIVANMEANVAVELLLEEKP